MTSGKNTRPLWHAYLAVAGAWTFGGTVFAALLLAYPTAISVSAERVELLAAVALIGTVFLFVLVERISNLIGFKREEREERRLRPERQRQVDEALANLEALARRQREERDKKEDS